MKMLCKKGWEINPSAQHKGLYTSACLLIPGVQRNNTM